VCSLSQAPTRLPPHALPTGADSTLQPAAVTVPWVHGAKVTPHSAQVVAQLNSAVQKPFMPLLSMQVPEVT